MPPLVIHGPARTHSPSHGHTHPSDSNPRTFDEAQKAHKAHRAFSLARLQPAKEACHAVCDWPVGHSQNWDHQPGGRFWHASSSAFCSAKRSQPARRAAGGRALPCGFGRAWGMGMPTVNPSCRLLVGGEQ